jgi:hypothetical protein
MTVLKHGNIFVQYWPRVCFLYERATKSWRRCPDMLTSRDKASCGVVVRGDGRGELVVAGGYGLWSGGYGNDISDTVEIFNPQGNGDMEIRYKNKLDSFGLNTDLFS